VIPFQVVDLGNFREVVGITARAIERRGIGLIIALAGKK